MRDRIAFFSVWIGGFGVLQYFVVTLVLMYYYPGGTLHDHFTTGYSFTENFLSDLGRTSIFGRMPNPAAAGYKWTLSVAGICTALFFTGLVMLFQRKGLKISHIITWVSGTLAGLAYVGIALHPVNMDYRSHVWYVKWGFIAFLVMVLSCAKSIEEDDAFNNLYARGLYLFAAILAIQIVIMLFGPRSWSSGHALLLQVISQKVVVYAEILTMLFLIHGVHNRFRTSP